MPAVMVISLIATGRPVSRPISPPRMISDSAFRADSRAISGTRVQ